MNKLFKNLILSTGVLYLSGQLPEGVSIVNNKITVKPGFVLIINGVVTKSAKLQPNNDYRIEVEAAQ